MKFLNNLINLRNRIPKLKVIKYLLNLTLVQMNLDEQFLEKTDKIRLIKLENENVTTIPVQNALRTRVKQIRNPQKEISGGFLFKMFKKFII